MSKSERIDLHADRALEELERARAAACPEAARAHLALSELHLGQLRALGEATGQENGLSLVRG
jgi:hypothetical protein